MKTFVFLLFIFCAVIYGNTVEGGLTSKVALSSFVKQKKQILPIFCFIPNPVINGQVWYIFPPDEQRSPEDTELIEGTRLEYTCDTEYGLQGPEFITCEITGSWSSDPPSCIKTFCEDPGFIENGNRADGIIESSTPRKFQENEFVIFYCNSDKFALRGSPLLSCKDGSWSRPIPRCIPAVAVTCSDPGQVPNADRYNSDGSLSAGVSSFKEGQIVVYSCKPNFYLQRRSFLTCLPSGQWSHSLPECIEVNSDHSIGFPEQTVTTEFPPVFCYTPNNVTNGQVRYIFLPGDKGLPDHPEQIYGTRLEYTCNTGYMLQGAEFITCEITGSWSSDPPSCVSA